MPTVTYPTFDQPPSYEENKESDGTAAVGQLIDLGIDLNSGPPSTVPQGTGGEGGVGDILGQLSDLGKEELACSLPDFSCECFLLDSVILGWSPTSIIHSRSFNM